MEWYTWDIDLKIRGEKVAVELYDNQADPKENISIAGSPENASLVKKLSKKLNASWKATLVMK